MIYIQCVEFHVYTLSLYVFYPVVLNLPFVLDLFFFFCLTTKSAALCGLRCAIRRAARDLPAGWLRQPESQAPAGFLGILRVRPSPQRLKLGLMVFDPAKRVCP